MRVVMAVLTLALVVSVAAGNPSVYWPTVGVTFDPTGDWMPRIDPPAYTAGEFYVAVVCPGGDTAHNVVTISFALQVDPGVSAPVSYTSLLPGGLAIGDWQTGISLSSTEPVYDAPVLVCSGSLFFLGAPGEIRILDHPDYPRWITNSESNVFYYCVETNGGVLMDPVYPGEDCGGWCNNHNAVENANWGAIKALYR